MNWRIQNQILIPIMLAMVIGVSLSTYFNIQGLVQNENQRVESQVGDLFDTLSSKSFPLQPSVLVQLEQLTGIHLLVSDGGMLASSFSRIDPIQLANELEQARSRERSTIVLLDREYSLYQRTIPEKKLDIQVLYPRDQFSAAIGKVVYPQVVSGVLTILAVGILVVLVARNVTLPIQSLKQHVLQIAEGNFSGKHRSNIEAAGNDEFSEPRIGNSEVGQLFQSVNEMATKLQQYEKRIRAQEKLLTLDQMGGGIAHQMRNSITGCRLALDLHRQNCQGDQESLDVATRQLTFMEDFQKRFLSFTKEHSRARKKMDLVDVVHQYTKLLEPFARHVNVNFHVDVPDEPQWIEGNESMIQQLVGNLVTNAIEAASTCQSTSEKSVWVEVRGIDGKSALIVRDTGEGISPAISEQLFEPLVTTKADGVGLGLAIVKQTVNEHQAQIDWNRINNRTEFCVVFPSLGSTVSTKSVSTKSESIASASPSEEK